MCKQNSQGSIELKGAGENNLKHINLSIPKGKIVVFTGVSGSGKSSIVFDTIAVESQRQLNETFPLFVRNRMPRYERPKADFIENLTPAIVINQKPISGNSRSTVGTMTDIAPLIRLLFSRIGQPSAGMSTNYSFNDPSGMCPVCSGLGEQVQLDLDKLLDKSKSLNSGAIRFRQFAVGSWQWKLYAHSGFFDADKPLAQYSEEEWHNLLHGTGQVLITPNNKTHDEGQRVKYEGLVERFNRLWLNRDISTLSKSNQKEVQGLVCTGPCPECHGDRLNKADLASKIDGYNIADFTKMEVVDLIPILLNIKHPMGTPIAAAAAAGLQRIVDIGLGYLHLDRKTETLSGGEGQRLKMVRHLGSSLTGMTYILDEPSVGLHPRDIARLNQLLVELRDKGNSVLVVEHDRDVIHLADEVVDIGPGAGKDGGMVVYQGNVEGLLQSGTVTGRALAQTGHLNQKPRRAAAGYRIENARLHNLKNVTVEIPAKVLTAVTGVAGSGKSTLVVDVFLKQFPQAIVVDQKPIGSTSRSTPATYTGVMDEIRRLFSAENSVEAGMFSFNSTGACPVCHGKGEIVPDMAFADPVAVCCEACGGSRYSDEALSYLYHGKSIVEVLELTIAEAIDFFPQKKIAGRLETLREVGLGYMTLGQPTSTLSGGENQRVKLASELHKSGNIYVMDEPTTGLHMADISKLMELMNRLVEQGNTVIVVEHNLDVIAGADWIIDLGPDGGKHGGNVVFEGTPEEMLEARESWTSRHLIKSVVSVNQSN